METVTLEQAIVIYARASRVWFGPTAADRAEGRAQAAAEAEDANGAKVWTQVAAAVRNLEEAEKAERQPELA